MDCENQAQEHGSKGRGMYAAAQINAAGPVDIPAVLYSPVDNEQGTKGATLDVNTNIATLLSGAIAEIGNDNFWRALHLAVAAIVDHQMAAGFVYTDRDPPTRIF